MFIVEPEHCPYGGAPDLIQVRVYAQNGNIHNGLFDASGSTAKTTGVQGTFVKLECNGKPLCDKCT